MRPPLKVSNNLRSTHFNEAVIHKQHYDLTYVCPNKSFKLWITDIACRDKPQLARRLLNVERIHKISVLRSHDAIMRVSILHNIRIIGFVLLWEIKGMNGYVTITFEDTTQTPWQMGIHQKLHATITTVRLT